MAVPIRIMNTYIQTEISGTTLVLKDKPDTFIYIQYIRSDRLKECVLYGKH